MKRSHPIEITEYAEAQRLERKPTFNWRAPFVIKKRERIISLGKKRNAQYLKKDESLALPCPRMLGRHIISIKLMARHFGPMLFQER